MKTSKILLATALLAGFATLSFAGPGPQFWAQQAKNQQEQKAKTVRAPETAKDTVACLTCACCADTKKV